MGLRGGRKRYADGRKGEVSASVERRGAVCCVLGLYIATVCSGAVPWEVAELALATVSGSCWTSDQQSGDYVLATECRTCQISTSSLETA